MLLENRRLEWTICSVNAPLSSTAATRFSYTAQVYIPQQGSKAVESH